MTGAPRSDPGIAAPPSVPLLRALQSLLDGIYLGCLHDMACWKVLVACSEFDQQSSCEPRPRNANGGEH